MRPKPDILKALAEISKLSAQLERATHQAKKFAEQYVHFEQAGNKDRAKRAKAQVIQWLIRERGLKARIADLESIVAGNQTALKHREY